MAGECKGKGLRRSREEWRALIAQYEREGGRVKEFCRRQGMSAASFYRWRGVLGPLPGAIREASADEADPFVDLGTLHRKTTAASAKPRL